MNNRDSFNKQNEISKPSVKAVIESLESWHWLVKDVEDSKYFQSIDVDLVVDDCKYVEVKYDTRMRQTGNLFIENISCCEVMSKGWFQKTRADQIYYIEAKKNEYDVCHIFNMDELRDYVQNEKPIAKRIYDYQDRKWKEAYLVSIDKVKKFPSYDSFLLAV